MIVCGRGVFGTLKKSGGCKRSEVIVHKCGAQKLERGRFIVLEETLWDGSERNFMEDRCRP